MKSIGDLIGDKTFEITNDLAKKLLDGLLELPSYFSKILITRCTNNPKAEKATKGEFIKVWKIL